MKGKMVKRNLDFFSTLAIVNILLDPNGLERWLRGAPGAALAVIHLKVFHFRLQAP